MVKVTDQKRVFKSGNEGAAWAAKQIDFDVMGYYPITPSTQIAEEIDLYRSEGLLTTKMIPAEGEHSAAGICYGASTGGRVINATSANGLLYALEQLPVQSGTRYPMVLNVACRTVSGPLSIKGDHSDIMYALNCGWLIFFAKDNQQVYDFNIVGLKVAEEVSLSVIIAYDGFFTSHQKKPMFVFENDDDVKGYLGEYKSKYSLFDPYNPITIGSYMNEPDLLNNKYQLNMAMEKARDLIVKEFEDYSDISGRKYNVYSEYKTEDAEVIIFALGSAYDTAREAVDTLRESGKKAGAFTIHILRPFPSKEIAEICKNAEVIIVAERQDSYGSNGGNMSKEIKSAFYDFKTKGEVLTRIFGLGGRDFYVDDAIEMFEQGFKAVDLGEIKRFDYYGHYCGNGGKIEKYFEPVTEENGDNGITVEEKNDKLIVKGVNIKKLASMPKRVVAGHGACPGCGIPVNLNLLSKGLKGNVVFLFQTGCGMVVTTAYPKTAFNVNFIHNLFQNGAATLSGIVEMYKQKQRKGEMASGKITFVMVSGDGGLDIGLGSALGAAIRNHNMIIFEYDNGGYMNTGYQLSYSTPLGAKSATSHVGKDQSGKSFLQKDNPQLFADTGIPYVATVSESNVTDFIKKVAKAQYYADNYGTAYIKAISACPLNWGDYGKYERIVADKGVKSCYHPLYEVERGITTINYNPELKNEKIPVADFLGAMGRTKHLLNPEFSEILSEMQKNIDLKWEKLKAKAENSIL